MSSINWSFFAGYGNMYSSLIMRCDENYDKSCGLKMKVFEVCLSLYTNTSQTNVCYCQYTLPCTL